MSAHTDAMAVLQGTEHKMTTTTETTNSIIAAQRTVTVLVWGERHEAYADAAGVLVYDDCAGHYTRCHSLTAGQIRYVTGRTLGSVARNTP